VIDRLVQRVDEVVSLRATRWSRRPRPRPARRASSSAYAGADEV
jgi:hypothetical protein